MSSLTSNYVKSIGEDSDHNLWIATTMGLNRFDRSRNNFHRYFYEFDIVIKSATVDALVMRQVSGDVRKAEDRRQESELRGKGVRRKRYKEARSR